MIRDLLDLREDKWVPRRKEAKATKTEVRMTRSTTRGRYAIMYGVKMQGHLTCLHFSLWGANDLLHVALLALQEFRKELEGPGGPAASKGGPSGGGQR
jgi:hypothetical protein